MEDDFESIEKLQQLGINIGASTAAQASISLSYNTQSKLHEWQQEVLNTLQQLCRASCSSLASLYSALSAFTKRAPGALHHAATLSNCLLAIEMNKQAVCVQGAPGRP